MDCRKSRKSIAENFPDSEYGESFFADRIKRLRIKSKLTQIDLADALHIGRSAVCNWETGRTRPDISNLPALCGVLNVSVSEFFTGISDDSKLTDDEHKLLSLYRSLEPQKKPLVMSMAEILVVNGNIRKEPANLLCLHFAEEAAAAGVSDTGFEAKCRPFYVRSSSLMRKAHLLFRVNGRSMEPDYPDKCIVVLQKVSDTLKPGNIGVFQVNGSLYIKEYRDDGLYSLNARYKPMLHHEYDDEQVIGKVIGILSKSDIATRKEIEAFCKENHNEVQKAVR